MRKSIEAASGAWEGQAIYLGGELEYSFRPELNDYALVKHVILEAKRVGLGTPCRVFPGMAHQIVSDPRQQPGLAGAVTGAGNLHLRDQNRDTEARFSEQCGETRK